jgi:hypothetical protein
MIDYKINKLAIGETGVDISITVYEGDITTEDEMNIDTNTLEAVTRYRRTSVLTTREFNLPIDKMTRIIEKYINKKVLEQASAAGKTVISEQQSTSV